MKIESIIKRKNGTTVQFGKTAYHFKPEVSGGAHVADVGDDEHAEKLLLIAEGYREAGKSTAQAKPQLPAASKDTTEFDAEIVELLGQSIAKIKAVLPILSDEQISTAIEFEQAAEAPRKSLVDLLTAETARRAEDLDE